MTTKNIGPGWIGDITAKVLQECQNGLLSSTYRSRGDVAVLTRTGRRKGLRIEIPTPQQGLF